MPAGRHDDNDEVEELYCELNYYDLKIRGTLTHDIRKHWTAVSTLLGPICSVYYNLKGKDIDQHFFSF